VSETSSRASESSLQIDDEAVVWSVSREERSERLAEQPLVIVMHGRGSHENDLAALFPLLPEGVVYASLRAPISGAPWGMGGWTWFPLEADGPTPAAAEAAASAVLEWVDRTEQEYGAPPAIAALGFSQGGMMSIELHRAKPYRFAAAVNLSGTALRGERAGDDDLARRKPPLFWGYDLEDPIIPAIGIERTEVFAPAYFSVTERRYDGIAHSISPEELGDVSRFLQAVLPLEVSAQTPAETTAETPAEIPADED